MPSICKFFCSSIGRKLLMSATGLAMSLFLLAHVAGNLLLLLDTEKFNAYGHSLTSNKMILYPAEAGLILVLLIHIYTAVRLTMINKSARPVAYGLRKSTGRSRRFFGSSYMMLSGFFIFCFIIYHLNHFKFGAEYTVVQGGVEVRDLARLVIDEFKELDEVIIYIIALLILFVHLIHGFRSAFETLGLATSNKWDRAFGCFAKIYVIAVMGGFILIPLWIYFCASPMGAVLSH